MVSLAVMFTKPAFPRPLVLASTCPPLVRLRLPVSMVIFPAFPTASEFTRLVTPLAAPSESSPSMVMVSLAVILTEPASPRLLVLVSTEPPCVIDRSVVVILISPAFPIALSLTALLISPSVRETLVALIVISPAFPCPSVKASNDAPLVKETLVALIVISPPLPCPADLTPVFISASVKETLFALIVTSPAFPIPFVLGNITAPLLRENISVVIFTSPPSPSVSVVFTTVKIELGA